MYIQWDSVHPQRKRKLAFAGKLVQWEYSVRQNKPNSEKQVLHVFFDSEL